MKKIKKGNIVYLEWIDSAGNSGWIDIEENDITGVTVIQSVGMVLKITKEFITIIQSRQLDGDLVDNYINIPLFAICESKLLSFDGIPCNLK